MGNVSAFSFRTKASSQELPFSSIETGYLFNDSNWAIIYWWISVDSFFYSFNLSWNTQVTDSMTDWWPLTESFNIYNSGVLLTRRETAVLMIIPDENSGITEIVRVEEEIHSDIEIGGGISRTGFIFENATSINSYTYVTTSLLVGETPDSLSILEKR